MDIATAWRELTSKPKWYAGIRNRNGDFYTAQAARKLKINFKNGSLKICTMVPILRSHGYNFTIEGDECPSGG